MPKMSAKEIGEAAQKLFGIKSTGVAKARSQEDFQRIGGKLLGRINSGRGNGDFTNKAYSKVLENLESLKKESRVVPESAPVKNETKVFSPESKPEPPKLAETVSSNTSAPASQTIPKEVSAKSLGRIANANGNFVKLSGKANKAQKDVAHEANNLLRARKELRNARKEVNEANKTDYGGLGASDEQMEAAERLEKAQERVKAVSSSLDDIRYKSQIDEGIKELGANAEFSGAEVAGGDSVGTAIEELGYGGGAGGKKVSNAEHASRNVSEGAPAAPDSGRPVPQDAGGNVETKGNFDDNSGAGRDTVEERGRERLSDRDIKNSDKFHVEDRLDIYQGYKARVKELEKQLEKQEISKEDFNKKLGELNEQHGIGAGVDPEKFFLDQINGKATTWDWIRGNNVIEIGAGGALAAGAIASCFSNKGKMSNSELYGQNF